MLRRQFLFVLALLLVTALPAWAQNLAERQTAPGGGFSLRPPTDWKVTTNEQNRAIMAAGAGGVNLQAREVEFDGPLQTFADASMQALSSRFPDFKKLDNDTFETKSRLTGLQFHFEHRMEAGGPLIRQMIFFFDGRAGYKIFMTCGAPANLDQQSHPTYEAVASSLRLGQ